MRTTQFGTRPGSSSLGYNNTSNSSTLSSGYGSGAGSNNNNRPSLNNNNNTNNTNTNNNFGSRFGAANTNDVSSTGGRTLAPAFGSLAAGGSGGGGGGILGNRPGSSGYGAGNAGQRASSAGIGSRLPASLNSNALNSNNNNNTLSRFGSGTSNSALGNNNNTHSPMAGTGGGGRLGGVNTSNFQTTNSQIGAHSSNNINSLLNSVRPGSNSSLNMPNVTVDPNHPAARGALGNSNNLTSPTITSPGTTGSRVGLSRFGNTIGAGARFGGAGADANNNNQNQTTATAPAFSCTVLSSQSRSSVKPLSIFVGSGCTQGFRPTMEDEHINMIGAKTVDGNPMSLFAILDGHCGRRVAELGSQMLPEALFNHPQIGQNNAQAFVESVMQIDRQIHTALRNQDGGATLISALIHKRMLFVACLGDARAVVCDNGVAVAMSIDHKPSDPPEQARIIRCGGFVHFGRVSGCLAVSRALGDFEFKISMGRFVQKEFQVSNIADIRQINLTDGSKFLILACDGLWDVMRNEEAVNWVNDYLAKNEAALLKNVTETLNRASQAMAEAAVAKGSTDNVSVTIVLFHAPGSDKQ